MIVSLKLKLNVVDYLKNDLFFLYALEMSRGKVTVGITLNWWAPDVILYLYFNDPRPVVLISGYLLHFLNLNKGSGIRNISK